jgi:hypothetical protein
LCCWCYNQAIALQILEGIWHKEQGSTTCSWDVSPAKRGQTWCTEGDDPRCWVLQIANLCPGWMFQKTNERLPVCSEPVYILHICFHPSLHSLLTAVLLLLLNPSIVRLSVPLYIDQTHVNLPLHHHPNPPLHWKQRQNPSPFDSLDAPVTQEFRLRTNYKEQHRSSR